jgi:uncharacterized protein
MIVDCHSHIHDYPGHVSEELAAEARACCHGTPPDLHVPPARHWQAMHGVDKAIVVGFRAFHSGFAVPNEYVADYVRLHPEKLIGFASVDPAHDPVRDTLEHAIDDLKLRGVKLGPIYQNLHPMDAKLVPVYEFCQSRNLPVIIHQAATFPRKAPLKYALPILLEEVALAFPRLRMVLAHLGHPWINETLVLIRKHPNLFADISALHYRPWQFYNALIAAKEYGVLPKLLFGSDYPYTTPEATIEALKHFNQLVAGTPLPQLGEEEIEALIHSPTLQLLHLE